jgi:ubiquinone/menaquinone biosynthesis C-methylase UbiE
MLIKTLHNKFVYNRRMSKLSDIIGNQLESGSKVLDVGCGDGKIDKLIMEKNNVDICGVDVLLRDTTYIPVKQYNGSTLPYNDNEFDTIIFIDVLHHTESPFSILKEAKRVAKNNIIIKDHLKEGLFANCTLKFMDYFGNAHYGVNLPYNYLDKKTWDRYFSELNLSPTETGYITKLNLYPFPFSILFDRKLHFLINLTCNSI